MKAVVTVIGKDNVGIIAEISTECAKHGVNIVDITQSVLRDYFAMIMLVEIENMNATLKDFQLALDTVGKEKGLDIRVMHEDIFNSMHRIQRLIELKAKFAFIPTKKYNLTRNANLIYLLLMQKFTYFANAK